MSTYRFLGRMCSHCSLPNKPTPSKLLQGKTPYEVLFQCKPSYNDMKVFGVLCFARNNPRTKDKFASRSRKCVFMGYPFGKKGWKVYDLETREIFISRDVVFDESIFPFAKNQATKDLMADHTQHTGPFMSFDHIGPSTDAISEHSGIWKIVFWNWVHLRIQHFALNRPISHTTGEHRSGPGSRSRDWPIVSAGPHRQGEH